MMKSTRSRREFAALLPAAVVATAAASSQVQAAPAVLKSTTYKFEDLPVREGATSKGRNVFDGATHSGFHIDMHLTELLPGKMPHGAHKHEHEELLMIREGSLEVTIEGKVTTVGPGSVVYVASNEMHGWKNVSDKSAHYFVMALGRPSGK
jgi:quercetin dioxygenase-like cupin family protein